MLLLVSCNKKGCTDSAATNYVEEATKDDGSCTYEGTVTFWYDQQTSISLEQSGVTELNFYVGSVLAKTHPVDTYWTIAPNCNDSNTISRTKNLGASKNTTIPWEVEDQSGNTLYSGNWEAVGGQCTLIEID